MDPLFSISISAALTEKNTFFAYFLLVSRGENDCSKNIDSVFKFIFFWRNKNFKLIF